MSIGAASGTQDEARRHNTAAALDRVKALRN